MDLRGESAKGVLGESPKEVVNRRKLGQAHRRRLRPPRERRKEKDNFRKAFSLKDHRTRGLGKNGDFLKE